MTIRRFEMEIDRFSDEDVPEALGRYQRVLSAAALNGLVLKTPVDTSRARGAWITSIDVQVSAAPSEGDSGRSRKDRTAAASTNAITVGMGVIGGLRPYHNLIIQNNVYYIEDLEDGGSRQAPAGMLAVTVAEIERLAR